MDRLRDGAAATGASEVGDRIRRLRKSRGLTLVELGAATGLSHGFLSQLERGLSRSSMSTLERVAAALGSSPAALMAHRSTGFAHLVRATEARELRFPNGRNEVIAHVLTRGDTMMKIIETVGSFDRQLTMAHPGEEAVYVLEGQVEIDVDGTVFLLGPGDLLDFDCSAPHRYRAIGTTPLRALQITVDPGGCATEIASDIVRKRQADSSM